MKNKIESTIVAVVLAAGAASAQLGSTGAQCAKVWGSPVGGKLDKSGSGLLRYSSRGVAIELDFFEGTAFRARYSKPGMDDKDVDSLLRLNNNKVEWDVWTIPGIPLSEQKSTRWMRSDEGAMAELKEGKLSILMASPVSRQRVKATASQPKSAKTPTATSQPPPPKKKPAGKPPVERPEALPIVGDSRDRALELLGAPSGTMMAGEKEILVYDWGNIWVAQGKVIRVN